MKNKFISLFLAFVMLITSLSCFAMSASAKSYADKLRDKGFPESYISSLVSLHEEYPNWDFEVFDTGLNWADAVKGERSHHSKQLIQKQSSLSSNYYCDCSSCYKNGSYVAQEGSSWVSASESAVKYYMDPRNWLSEKYIFQFESTSYDSSQTTSGIESIIASTWMHNANISYVDTEGDTVTYKTGSGDKLKYSSAILKAAKNSGMSAYYLASKIVQEVGGTKATAGGVVGTRSPFIGIYNYYNIGAYSTATQGLAWAAGYLKSTKSTTLYSKYDEDNDKGTGTKTSVSADQYMTYIGEYGKYYKVRLYDESGTSFSTNGKVGYVPISALRTTYFNYSRPWTNPYKSIYHGAEYIANSFSKYQNTGYLQKFNVNSASGSLYNHEYMANVQAAADESVTTYKAYKSAGILSTAKTFYIPVYDNMPSKKCTVTSSGSSSSNSSSNSGSSTSSSTKVTNLKLTSRKTDSLSFSWSKVSNATKYYVYIKNNTKGTNFSKTVTTNSATLNGLTESNEYSVKVKAYVNGAWKSYSEYNTQHTKPTAVKDVKVSSKSTTSVTLSWSKKSNVDGYYIYKYVSSTDSYTKVKTVKGASKTSAKITDLKSGTSYTYCVSAYVTDDSTSTAGAKSSKVTTCTKPATVTLSSVSSTSSTKIKAEWKAVTGNATGYQIYYARDSKFDDVVAKKNVSKKSTTSYTGKNFTSGKTYYVKVRAYRTVSDKTYYGSWSKSIKVTCK